MDQQAVQEARIKELRAILDSIRYECSDLIDDYFVAFVESGRPWQEWLTVSKYERHLFQVANDEQMTFEERRGALKLCRGYLRRVIRMLRAEGCNRTDLVTHD